MSQSDLAGARIRATVEIGSTRRDEAPITLVTFAGLPDDGEHLAACFRWPLPAAEPVPLVRMHSECLTGDLFGSSRCDCGPQLQESMRRLRSDGGVLLYMRQEGRGVGLYNKLDAYVLQDRGYDTFGANEALGFPADARDYGAAAAMLSALGIERVRLLTNNPDKVRQLDEYGVSVTEVVSTGVFMTHDNVDYLRAKSEHAQHNLTPGRR